ncbi:hypothetical protein GOP47_0024917 [Adiantum capillus-veneris]|uniref:Uncharacterized protein n=1 Tax=Adiantum capillus-veneris TaxID=13818 RepID=A0A9D4U354_ADICA|nr:hypothetical protein GOP47_0024917 [Adiantum capillus-veneris]
MTSNAGILHSMVPCKSRQQLVRSPGSQTGQIQLARAAARDANSSCSLDNDQIEAQISKALYLITCRSANRFGTPYF